MIAEVIVDVPARATDRPYDYLVPEELMPEVRVGSRVQVPFGHRKLIGYVVRLKEQSETRKLKSVSEVMDILPPLTPELVELGFMMADEYLCHTITALQSMVPSVLKGKYQKIVRYLGEKEEPDTLRDLVSQPFLDYLKKIGECTWEEALNFGVSASSLRQLSGNGLIGLEERVGDRVTRQKATFVKPASAGQLQEAIDKLSGRAKRQKEVLQFFQANPGEIALPHLLAKLQVSRSTVQSLVDKGSLIVEEREELRDPYRDRDFQKTEPLTLTPEQKKAIAPILASVRHRKAEAILLQGVTGSGKTEIYLQAIAEVLKQGQETIVLVPEISLTPQMVHRFKGRFGEQVAVLHSKLSSGERYDEWRKIRHGEVKVAIGARSAIFAPFRKIGLIIIDEEHESSYKQEENPKYHARQIAWWRAQKHQATLVLGSATPSLETWMHAQKGYYQHIELKERVHGRPFPEMKVVDMRKELLAGNRSMFSESLREELTRCIDRGEQAVLFLNRRGFSTFVMCRECGETLTCPHCDISLTYHQTNRTVRCHYCGYAERVPEVCPSCGSKHIRHFGVGTQRIESELSRHFPGIRVIRMDVDTTGRKGAHERLLGSFGAGRADVLLGTQMIAKGLDFPKVTLVGVIAADTMLHLPDFRSAERTFQLLTQVSGRAGRHEKPGKVVIQTYNAEHYSISLAASRQTSAFYQQETRLRKLHDYPPFSGMFSVLVSHPDRVKVMRSGQVIALRIKRNLPPDCQMLGPVPAQIPRIKDRYRLQILIKYSLDSKSVQTVKDSLREIVYLTDDPDLKISLDRDGMEPVIPSPTFL
ncbi:primosomal protein N' [Thermoactinomyces sp. AMNI-1]|uniref:Replication restart protein PriA n=1 Tax=Thermoactinomyces mirandus TaxID=2756294 RepID=A0A7W1XSB6_9BACL|nr:primosomal protein N' [Thermoactinomyces mirandus]